MLTSLTLHSFSHARRAAKSPSLSRSLALWLFQIRPSSSLNSGLATRLEPLLISTTLLLHPSIHPSIHGFAPVNPPVASVLSWLLFRSAPWFSLRPLRSSPPPPPPPLQIRTCLPRRLHWSFLMVPASVVITHLDPPPLAPTKGSQGPGPPKAAPSSAAYAGTATYYIATSCWLLPSHQ
ncbi:hypothetical protein IWX49DRAFT_222420 [Phyllosticta citricarpa]